MIRLAGLALLALVALACAGWALARALVSWRQERRRRSLVLSAQREADLREQVARRRAREEAKDEIEDAEYRDPPAALAGWQPFVATWAAGTWTEGTVTRETCGGLTFDGSHSEPVVARPHPLGWQTVGLTGGVLCAVGPCFSTGHPYSPVDRYDSPSCAWVRVLHEEPLHRQAVEAVGA